jgi:hypothetical protein
MKKHQGTIVDLALPGLRGQVTTVITARRSAAFLDHLTVRADFMTDSKWTPAGVIVTSTNASNGSGNLDVFSYSACEQDYMNKILKILATVSINFVALLSSIVASTGLLVNAGCCITTTFIVRCYESIANILLCS